MMQVRVDINTTHMENAVETRHNLSLQVIKRLLPWYTGRLEGPLSITVIITITVLN